MLYTPFAFLVLTAAATSAALPPGDSPATAAAASPAVGSAVSHDPRGLWQGKLQQALRLVVHVNSDSAGGLTSTIDSPDQGAMGL